jgi:hypothetical protein
MAHSNSPLGQLSGVVPATSDPPDVQGDLNLLITALEKKLNMTFASRAARDAAITVPVNGMRTHMTDVFETDERINGAWVKVYPVIYTGTADPSNGVGSVGNIYLKYV